MAIKRLFVACFGVLALATLCHSLALTTFGKSNPQNNNNYNNNQNNEKQSSDHPPARECISDSECAAIRGTSCLEPIFALKVDNKLRCLCGDYTEPKNGACENMYKSVRVQCSDHSECTPGALCLRSNDTSVPGNRCWCKKGYDVDEDMLCSGSPVAIGFSALSLIAGLLLTRNV
ncbi:uncharacterized protein LOC131669808 [Phymastichus coffea]|uniref:uncharacterized protein LOC131669808 n=1 Tax=Phymastichus coffea TaxID=108790 RepID=UPI00273B3424|nr:uncharacterized protein LOC131669808 [Phymastichus coffea]